MLPNWLDEGEMQAIGIAFASFLTGGMLLAILWMFYLELFKRRKK